MYLIYDTLGSDVPVMGLELIKNNNLPNLINTSVIKQFLEVSIKFLWEVIQRLWIFILATNKGITSLIIAQLILIHLHIKYKQFIEKTKLFIIPKPAPEQDHNIIDSIVFFTKITAYIIVYQQIKLYNYYFSENLNAIYYETSYSEKLLNLLNILKIWLIYYIFGIPARLQKIIKACKAYFKEKDFNYLILNPNNILKNLNKTLINYSYNWNILYVEGQYQINPGPVSRKNMSRGGKYFKEWLTTSEHSPRQNKIYHNIANNKKLNELLKKRENLTEKIIDHKYNKTINIFLKKNLITESGIKFTHNPVIYKEFLAYKSSLLGYETYETAVTRLIQNRWAGDWDEMKIFNIQKLNEMECIHEDMGRLFPKKIKFQASDLKRNLESPRFRGIHPISTDIVKYNDDLGGGSGALFLTHKQSPAFISSLGVRMGEITTLAYPKHSWAKDVSTMSPRPAAMIVPEKSILSGSDQFNFTEPVRRFEEINFTEADLLLSALDYHIKLVGSGRFIGDHQNQLNPEGILIPSWKFTDSNLRDAYTEFWDRTKDIIGCDEFVQTDYNDIISFIITNKAEGNHDIFRAYREDIVDALNHYDEIDLD